MRYHEVSRQALGLMLAVVFAFAAATGYWWPFHVVVAFLGFYYPTAIEYEDRKLASIFGDTWQEYAKTTPALLRLFQRSLSGS
jgi:protein-S-isoprenylcysteine O-methyltransferase Ste14